MDKLQRTARWPHSKLVLIGMALGAILFFCCFFSLGTWQVLRLNWKLDLIERVNQRVHAPAVPAPPRTQWGQINAIADEYRHVQVTGTFLPAATTLTQAVTTHGPGFWVLTPLRQNDDSIVLINRGFIPTEKEHSELALPTMPVTVTGLLRISEPNGGFLHPNDASAERWYSRDVAAIAKARGLGYVAPYFIDADAADKPIAGDPLAGLTIISFYNHHLVYAITWYTLALMVAGATWLVIREEQKRRRNTLES